MNRTSFLVTAALIIPFFGCGSDSTSSPSEETTGASGSASPAGTGTGGGGGSGGVAENGGGGMSGTSTMTMMTGMSDAAAAGSTGAGGAKDSGAPTGDGGGSTFPKRVLLYHFSTLVINSVPAQLTFLKNKLTEWGYENEDSVDPTKFTDDNLARYAAVAMINTCFEPFGAGKPDKPQSEALQRYLQKGGGLFGTHCAAVTFQSAQPPALYNQLIGARGKGANTEQPSMCTKVADHPSTMMLPATFAYQGNLDNHDYVAPDSTILVKCKWSTGMEVPTSFARTEAGAGRVFYTNFAKEDVDLKDANIGTNHILPGLAWVLHR
jgi:type 1 glutamine amidotransferase